jgi:hypothetical protein
VSIPHLTKLAHDYAGKVTFVGVSIWERTPEDIDSVAKFVTDMGDKMDYNVAADGTDGSGSVCGGLAGFRCPTGEACDVRVCWPDATGTCVPDPGTCTDVWMPVCGCDGLTYGNDCDRLAAAVALDHDGECATPCKPECRTGTDGTTGWYDGCTDALICPAACTGCDAGCEAIHSRSEGWYATCADPGVLGGCPTSGSMGRLIEWYDCAP